MALSSRAHAFSVDVLVGNSAKRKMLDMEKEESAFPEKEMEKAAVRKSQAFGKPFLLPYPLWPPLLSAR